MSKAALDKLKDAPIPARDAVANARERVQSGKTDRFRMCLRWVRESWQLPAVYPTAAVAWDKSVDKHKWSGDVDDIPFGAPVFSFRPGAPAGDAEHVFMCGGHTRDGVRVFRSNDVKTQGAVDVIRLSDITEKWGHTIRGWTGDLNGYNLNLPLSPNERKAAKKAASKK